MILLQKNFNTRLKVQICGKTKDITNYNNTDRHKQKNLIQKTYGQMV